MDDKLTCPFCAYRGRVRDFAMKKKTGTGYSRKKFNCPDCNQNMMRNTIYKEMSPYEWGFWLYASIRVWNRPNYRFYDRISWEKLKERVWNMGIAVDFWKGFREAKEASTTEWNESVDNAYKSDITQLKLNVVNIGGNR
jgi:hypothetical protein